MSDDKIFDVFGMDERVRALELWGREMNGAVKRVAENTDSVRQTIESKIEPAVAKLALRAELEDALRGQASQDVKNRWTGRERAAMVVCGLMTVVSAGAAVASLFIGG
jgi:hypothetical protein